MAIEWHDVSGYENSLSIGVDWNSSESNTSVSILPTVHRWDYGSMNHSGQTFSETLSPDPNGNGYWGELSPSAWCVCNTDTNSKYSGSRQVDAFGVTRAYSKGHYAQTVTLTISYYNTVTYYNHSSHSVPDGSSSWTLTIPALDSYSVSYNANGGSGAPSSQTKWYGETLMLSSTIPTRKNYEFLGWATSSDGEVAYAAGSSYIGNSRLTLYAVWKLKASTVGVYTDDGVRHDGIVHIYDDEGNLHYGIITVYDSNGVGHTV